MPTGASICRWLKGQSDKHGLEVLAYCLMTNHIHLIAILRDEDSLAKAVGHTHYLYTLNLNRFHGRSGHLWQNRYFSCAPCLSAAPGRVEIGDCPYFPSIFPNHSL